MEVATKREPTPPHLFEALSELHANLYNDVMCAQPNTQAWRGTLKIAWI